jgi:pSer/pThr/pTyr-binding forkhead associated (FHA) protein
LCGRPWRRHEHHGHGRDQQRAHPTRDAPERSEITSPAHGLLQSNSAFQSDGSVTVEDLGSKNGTTVRGERLSAIRYLEDDDDLVIGGVRFLFRTGARVLPTETDPSD